MSVPIISPTRERELNIFLGSLETAEHLKPQLNGRENKLLSCSARLGSARLGSEFELFSKSLSESDLARLAFFINLALTEAR